jgi:glycosyltransferase involved in cell wall biosynthesis
MQVAYLINRYPAASHSFIRREISALEACGICVSRFSVRRADPAQLPDPRDQEEMARTEVILDTGGPRLLAISLLALAAHPFRAWAALKVAFAKSDWRPANAIRRAAYFAEGVFLARALTFEGLQHIHAHFGTNSATVARIASILSGVPYSFTIHGPDEFDSPHQLDLAGKVRDCKFCVAISSFGRSQIMRWSAYSDWHKIKVVRCGVDQSFITLGDTRAVSDAPDLCAVARLSGQKGIPLLLDAVAELKRRGRKFRITLIGDGEMRADIERIVVDNELAEHVVLVGWADSATVIEHLLNSRAMVLPSFAEGLPVVIMEALALGRPVIVSAIAGTPELVDESCGWLVPAGSTVDLVSAMEEALDAPASKLNQMGQIGRMRVQTYHDAQRNSQHLAALIRMEEAGGA